jgi:hypothetical protein
MIFRPKPASEFFAQESILVEPSKSFPGRIYVSTIGVHLSPEEARRVAKALLRLAEGAGPKKETG